MAVFLSVEEKSHENSPSHQIFSLYKGLNIDTQHQLCIIASIAASTLIYLLLRSLGSWYYSRRKDPLIVLVNFKNLRSRWADSFCSLCLFLAVSTPIVVWKAYCEGSLFDYMVNTSWVGRPEIIIVALFQGRNLCDLIVGVDSSMLFLHHVMGMYSLMMVSTMKPYRDRYLGSHCMFLVLMETGSIFYNVYALWPTKRNRNLYFYIMSNTNIMGVIWHWIAGSLGGHRALHDPKVFFTCIVGSLMNYFRQKEVFAVCGYPRWLGGNGFLSPESVFSTHNVDGITGLPTKKKKGHPRYAVLSGQKLIGGQISKND